MAKDDQFITARFTKNQMKILETFMKRNKIKNKNKLIKKAIEDLLGITLSEDPKTGDTPTEYLSAYSFCQYLKKNLDPELGKKLENHLKKWSSKHWHDWIDDTNERLWYVDKIYGEFRKQGKVGRPPEKRKRGKPKTHK